ncbi:aromatic prenyltransferase [Hysterangium stoloniferum]|nr:aromatic prenyltransferase [Hysterangium stoloniferum]
MFTPQDRDSQFWWTTTGKIFSQMMQRAFYPVHQQYRYLSFFYMVILPELGPAPAFDMPFRSYMTDDHSPMELSWQFDKDGGAVARFAIDPVRRQSEGDARGPMGLFQDMASLKVLAPGVDLDWCHTCADMLTLQNTPPAAQENGTPEYPSQYFVGFDFSSAGIVLKAYFLPETRSTLTSVSKTTLVTDCLTVLSTPSSACPSPQDLLTPWKKVASFFDSLPADLTPNINIVAVDCVPSKQNRVKIYARTPRTSLSNLRRFLTLGRDLHTTSAATQRAYEQIKLMWYLLFPALADPKFDDVEAPVSDPGHLTGGLLWYYELRGGHPEPFPKVYLPVRHLCRDDEQVVQAVETFYRTVGNVSAADRYARDVRETFSHRPLSSRAGIHTYITFAAKQDDVEITSYFNPECYAPEYGSCLEAKVAQRLRVESLQEQHDWETVEE